MSKISGVLTALFGQLGNAVKSGDMSAIAKLVDEYKLTNEEIQHMEMEYEKEITKRLQADMQSDSKLSKSVRPFGFLIWTALMLFIILFDGNIGSFSVNKAYLPLIETTYTAFITFYIGSRGIEKVVRVWSKQNEKKT